MAYDIKKALPTQQFIDVRRIKNGVLNLKNGGLRQILMVSGVNFDLKSEEEQEAITYSYQNFLNSLNFSVQIFIHSRKINIEGYIENLGKLESQETNPLLKTQIAEYGEFIKSFTAENAIMNKTFFMVVPFDPVQLPTGAGGGFLRGLLGKKHRSDAEKTEDEKTFNQHASELTQRT